MSELEKASFEVKWSIENIKSWLETRNDILYSPPFLAGTLSNTRWKLSLTPNWQLGEKYTSFALQRDVEDDHPGPIDLNYELSFLTGNGSPLNYKKCTKKFAPKTISHELNAKQNVILNEKNEDYLPAGSVLTMCCKMWRLSKVSIAEQCSLLSVIGIKTLTQKISVYKYILGSTVPVNFKPDSPDISQIVLDVYVSDKQFIFETKCIESKSLNWCSWKLFALNGKGYKTEFDEKTNNTLPEKSNNVEKLQYISFSDFHYRYLPCGVLTLLLEITYYPSVVSECMQKIDKDNKLPCDESLEKCSVVKNFVSSDEKEESSDESEPSDSIESLCAAIKSHLSLTSLKDDMKSLYNDNLFCDTKLVTLCGKTFPVHRSVLSARSPVFKKMFTTDKKEKAGECIKIVDIGSDTLRQMLQFIYTDCTGDLDMPSTIDLYIASDKYEIISLKNFCLSFMKNNLCQSSVCDVFVLADTYQDKDLESAAREYFLIYYKEILCSEEWKLFMKNFCCLAAQVMYLKLTME